MPDSVRTEPYSTSSDPSDDSKAVAIIKSVGELSVPENTQIHSSDQGEHGDICIKISSMQLIGTLASQKMRYFN